MFDFLNMFTVGIEITCKGEKYIAVSSVPSIKATLYLAVKSDASIPTQVYLVEPDKPSPSEKK